MIKKIAVLIGSIFVVGTTIGLFIESLNWVVATFQSHWAILIWGLPPMALLVAYVEHFKGGKRLGNTAIIIDEIKRPNRHIHWLLAPWIYFLTLVFHFFGASVGRESTAVQMGASLTESLGRILKIPVSDRPIIVRMGLAAGFGAAFGVPFAGAVFGIETPLLFRKKDWHHFPFYLAASLGAHHWCLFLFGSEHSVWQHLQILPFEITTVSYLMAIFFFVALTSSYEVLMQATGLWLRKWNWWALGIVGGLLILNLTLLVANPTYNNLGVPLILQGFKQGATLTEAISKLGFTFISIVTGMKGGEVTPLMASGTLFGSWIGSLIPGLGYQVGAALGLVSLFSLRLRIPATATLMLFEIFNWKLALLGMPILVLIEFSRKKVTEKLFEGGL